MDKKQFVGAKNEICAFTVGVKMTSEKILKGYENARANMAPQRLLRLQDGHSNLAIYVSSTCKVFTLTKIKIRIKKEILKERKFNKEEI